MFYDCKRLQNQTTGEWMLIDDQDWVDVREVKWFFKNGRVVNSIGITYETYIGIDDSRVNPVVGPWNKLRKDYLMDS